MLDTDNGKKLFAVYIGWLVIAAVLLIQYFTLFRLAATAAAALYLLFAMIIGTGKNRELLRGGNISVTDVIGSVLGISCLLFLAYFGCYYYMDVLHGSVKITSEALSAGFVNIFVIATNGKVLLKAFLLVVFFVSLFQKKSWQFLWLRVIYKYLRVWTIFFFILFQLTASMRICLFFTGLTLLFLMTDMIRVDAKSKPVEDAWKGVCGWYAIISIVILLFYMFFPEAVSETGQAGYFEYYIFNGGLKTLNIVLFSAVILVLAVICGIFREKTICIGDHIFFASLESSLLVCVCLNRFYVAYWWVILAVYILFGMRILLTAKLPEEKRGIFGNVLVWHIAFTAAVLFYIVAAHSGRGLSAFVLLLGVFLFCVLLNRQKGETSTWKGIALRYTLALEVVAFSAAGYVYEARCVDTNFIWLLLADIVFVVLTWMVCYNPGIYQIADEAFSRCLNVVLFAVLCLCLCLRGGSGVRLEESGVGNQVNIEVSEKGAGNSVAEVHVYWLDDATEAIALNGDTALPEERELKSASYNRKVDVSGNGRLRVEVTDANGVVTTAVKWYHFCAYGE